MGTTRQAINELEKLAEEVKKKYESLPSGESLKKSGIGGNKKVEPIPNFVQADCENIIQGESNTWIVFGRDRPSTKSSGEMLKGASHAGSIDICAGRASTEAAETDENGQPIFFNNDFNLLRVSSGFGICSKTCSVFIKSNFIFSACFQSTTLIPLLLAYLTLLSDNSIP